MCVERNLSQYNISDIAIVIVSAIIIIIIIIISTIIRVSSAQYARKLLKICH